GRDLARSHGVRRDPPVLQRRPVGRAGLPDRRPAPGDERRAAHRDAGAPGRWRRSRHHTAGARGDGRDESGEAREAAGRRHFGHRREHGLRARAGRLDDRGVRPVPGAEARHRLERTAHREDSDRSRHREARRRRSHRVIRVARVRGAHRELPRARAGEAPAGPRRIAGDSITLAEARRLAVRAQLLDRTVRPRTRSILQTVEHLGYLQLDPTNVVARNHLLVLWSRLGRYNVADLDRLMWNDRAFFEYITFIAPISDLPMHALRMRAVRGGEGPYAARI